MNIGTVSRPPQPVSGDAGAVRRDAPERADPSPPAAVDTRNTRGAPIEAHQPGQQTELSRESLEKLVDRISHEIRIERRSLSFTIDDELGKTIVKVIDRETDEVIRQIPSEELLRVAEAIQAIMEQRIDGTGSSTATGLLIQEQA